MHQSRLSKTQQSEKTYPGLQNLPIHQSEHLANSRAASKYLQYCMPTRVCKILSWLAKPEIPVKAGTVLESLQSMWISDWEGD